MKLYYFMIIAIGLMYTFSLAGIETGSNHLIGALGMGVDDINSTVIDPSFDTAGEYDVRDIINQNSWWASLILAMIVAATLGAIRGVSILGSGISVDFISAIVAGISTFLFSMFSLDFFSILIYMKELNCIGGTCGWQFHLTWILIVPMLFGFGISLIQFIKGTE